MKLHAVAPGGPPEGQCKKEQEMYLLARDLMAPSVRLSDRWLFDLRRCYGRVLLLHWGRGIVLRSVHVWKGVEMSLWVSCNRTGKPRDDVISGDGGPMEGHGFLGCKASGGDM